MVTIAKRVFSPDVNAVKFAPKILAAMPDGAFAGCRHLCPDIRALLVEAKERRGGRNKSGHDGVLFEYLAS
jgi:citrate lyase beta subunit